MKDGCPFCYYEGPNLILMTLVPSGGGPGAIVFEPINPVTEGHVLVVPEKHVADFSEDGGSAVAVISTALRWIAEKKIESYNLITSKGADATQSVFHLHLHIVPRRPSDGLQLPWTNQEGGS